MLPSTWDEVLARVRSQEDPELCDPWLDRLTYKQTRDGVVLLVTPNHLYREWIVSNLEPVLLKHLRDITTEDFRIDYELADADAANSEPPAPAPTERPSGPAVSSSSLQMNAGQTFSSFVVGKGNQFAQAACESVANNPGQNYNPLFLFGGVGLGKTHLLNAVANRMVAHNPSARIVYLSAEEFTNELIHSIRLKRMDAFREKYRTSCDALLVDDIQTLSGKVQTQEEFFHTFNALHSSGRQIVVTADRYPKDIEGLEERLRSRFDWGLAADIQPPDAETKVAILLRKADQEGAELPQDVAFFIAHNASNNVRELEGMLTRLVAMSSFQSEPISLDFARDALRGYLKVETAEIQPDRIIQGVARHFSLKVSDIKGKRKTKQIARPRQIAMYLMKMHTSLSLPEIGRRFGGRHHTTVLHSVRKVKQDLSDASFEARLESVRKSLGLPRI